MITFEDLPDVGDWDKILIFARKFNGYEHFGSFEACAEAAKNKNRTSLEELQNELFFAYRAGTHTGDTNTLLHAYAELLPFFKKHSFQASSLKWSGRRQFLQSQ